MRDADDQQETTRLPKRGKYLKYYLAGFADGEGSFGVSIKRLRTARYGWVIDPVFQVYQHKGNKCVLEIFRDTLRCGYIRPKSPKSDVLVLIVDNRRWLMEKIIPFFDEYSIISQKREDYEKFREILVRMERKEHHTREGFLKIVKIALTMNKNGKQRKYKLNDILSGMK